MSDAKIKKNGSSIPKRRGSKSSSSSITSKKAAMINPEKLIEEEDVPKNGTDSQLIEEVTKNGTQTVPEEITKPTEEIAESATITTEISVVEEVIEVSNEEEIITEVSQKVTSEEVVTEILPEVAKRSSMRLSSRRSSAGSAGSSLNKSIETNGSVTEKLELSFSEEVEEGAEEVIIPIDVEEDQNRSEMKEIIPKPRPSKCSDESKDKIDENFESSKQSTIIIESPDVSIEYVDTSGSCHSSITQSDNTTTGAVCGDSIMNDIRTFASAYDNPKDLSYQQDLTPRDLSYLKTRTVSGRKTLSEYRRGDRFGYKRKNDDDDFNNSKKIKPDDSLLSYVSSPILGLKDKFYQSTSTPMNTPMKGKVDEYFDVSGQNLSHQQGNDKAKTWCTIQ